MNTSIIVCDFDGTITKVDSINDFLERFADKEWLKVEDEWVAGRVGTCDASIRHDKGHDTGKIR